MSAVLQAVTVQISMPEETERIPAAEEHSLDEKKEEEETKKDENHTNLLHSSPSDDAGSEAETAIEIESPSSTAGSNEEVFTVEGKKKKKKPRRADKEESKLQFLVQTCIPFFLAGFGMVGAGILLDKWKEDTFLKNMPEAIVLIPALLGLKGNLEMTMASRLSTMAHLGQIDHCKQKWRVFYSNLAVDQAQAILVSLLASLFAIAAQLIQGHQSNSTQTEGGVARLGHSIDPSRHAAGDLTTVVAAGNFSAVLVAGSAAPFNRALCLMLASTLTATVTSFVLASLMLSVTFAARALRLNPDNISTPIAAALGDLTSLASLVLFGTLLYPLSLRWAWTPWLVVLQVVLLGSSLFWAWMAWKEEITRNVLKYAWLPVLAAMILSTAGGAVLQNTIKKFAHIGLFQPLINGVGGNLVAVQSSKISTHLFRTAKYGQLPANSLLTYLNPARTFSCKERESLNALILLGLALPGHLLFLGVLFLINWTAAVEFVQPTFVLAYLAAALAQVALLLYSCQLLCRSLWLYGQNPDINSIPLLTALGDLLGSVFLACAFLLHAALK